VANGKPTNYWDACVFLAAIDGDAERVPVIETVLDECEAGKVDIVTSHLSITEVCFSKEEKTNGK
jgi:predicted nucleic acid-binding protein